MDQSKISRSTNNFVFPRFSSFFLWITFFVMHKPHCCRVQRANTVRWMSVTEIAACVVSVRRRRRVSGRQYQSWRMIIRTRRELKPARRQFAPPAWRPFPQVAAPRTRAPPWGDAAGRPLGPKAPASPAAAPSGAAPLPSPMPIKNWRTATITVNQNWITPPKCRHTFAGRVHRGEELLFITGSRPRIWMCRNLKRTLPVEKKMKTLTVWDLSVLPRKVSFLIALFFFIHLNLKYSFQKQKRFQKYLKCMM